MGTENIPQENNALPRPSLPSPPAHLGKKWLDDADEIFSYLEQHGHKKEHWWKTTGAPAELLKQAGEMLALAEKDIGSKGAYCPARKALHNRRTHGTDEPQGLFPGV